MAAGSIEVLEQGLRSLSLEKSRVLFEFTLIEKNHEHQLLQVSTAVSSAPIFRKPAIGTSFAGCPTHISSSSLPNLQEFWFQLLQHDDLKDVALWFSQLRQKETVIIISRRRCLKSIWLEGILRDEWQKGKLSTDGITAVQADSIIWLDIPRKVSSEGRDAALDAGYQFQTLCTENATAEPSGVVPGFFTAVSHSLTLPDGRECVLILLGEIDGKIADGQYVELKCKSSHIKYFPLSEDEKLVQWVAGELNLAKILVRGHRNKFKDQLDKIEVADTTKLVTSELSKLLYSLLTWRLQCLAGIVELTNIQGFLPQLDSPLPPTLHGIVERQIQKLKDINKLTAPKPDGSSVVSTPK